MKTIVTGDTMQEILHYLEMKNQYYEKFYHLTLKFIDQINQNRWEDIDLFVDNRDRILNIIRSFDQKVAKHFDGLNLSPEEMAQYKAHVKDLMATRQLIAEKIFAADLELIGKIDEIKSETIRELKHSLETSNQMNAYSDSAKRPSKPRKEA